MGRNDAEGKVSLTGVKQQADLGILFLQNILELLVGQEAFLCHLVCAYGRYIVHDMACKLAGRVPDRVHEHHVQPAGSDAHQFSHSTQKNFFLEYQDDLPLLVVLLPAVDQAVVDAFAEFFTSVGFADNPGFQVEHTA